MQNTSQAYRGAGAQGVNYSEHSYENHGVHCQPSGYQPYPNQPYHPIPSPRPHHYGNHQMQQSMPYRHGGAYAPNQNQYGSNMNQDMYRNHSGYTNNRNMSSKPWTDNNSTSEMMAPYGQHSHPQMMNNPPPQIPVSTMRSPPHATSNMNPVPPQGQQHYRQMQSPAHSPHSWSQAQIPSPGVMHSSRTTPSPLPTHARSPGHSQPFSPPTTHAMNMQAHSQPPENGQLPQPINSVGGTESQNPSNPLHSLQKMVMLDQDAKTMLPIMGDGSEQYPNHCGPPNYAPEENVNPESKDSVYSTYYNMDENRFESKPSGSSNAYSAVQQVQNCNYPVPPPHMVNSEDVQSNPILQNNSSNIPDCLQPDQSSLTSQRKNLIPLSHSQINLNLVQKDNADILSDCPPHAESAPLFTDQTEGAVSTNSEQALELKPDLISKSDSTEIPSSENPPNMSAIEKLESSEFSGLSKDQSQTSETVEAVDQNSIKVQNETEFSNSPSTKIEDKMVSTNDNNAQCDTKMTNNPVKIDSDVDHHNPSNVFDSIQKSEELETKIIPDCNSDVSVKKEVESEQVLKTVQQDHMLSKCDENKSSLESDIKNLPNETPSTNSSESTNSNSIKCDKSLISNNTLCHSSVKVVIHRVRKDDTNDTWHVPDQDESSTKKLSNTTQEKKPDIKIPNVGPQIVILSPAKSERKFGFSSSVDENSIITIKEEGDEDIQIMERTPSTPTDSRNIKSENSSPNSNNNSRNSDKKRGRPVGSKNKIKPGGCMKKKKGRKGSKKKKFENIKQKSAETLPKNKKAKIFNGPYVHITGCKENPSSISVVNVAQKEEEKVNKVPVKRNFTTTTANRIKKKPVGHLSTLSPTYDAFNRDKTWLCIFCHKGSHHGGLGDLYGPYYIKDKNYGGTKSLSIPNTSGTTPARTKKRKSDHEERASKKSKQSAGQSVEVTPNRNTGNDSSDPDSNLKETWIHEDCAVWCQSISLFGEEVQGLEEAVTEAYENTCCKCSLIGATLGCWGKGCKELFHFSCAKEMGCQMDIENFSLLCPKHQKKSPDQQTRCQ